MLDFRQGWKPDDDSLLEFWRQWVHTPEAALPETQLAGADREQNPRFVPGSNAWAVDASVSSTDSVLVASDMHLDYSMPPPFYRARLRWAEGGRDHDVIAVTTPGTTAAGAGSNGQVAWVATNADLDLVDQIALEISPDHPDRYRVGGEWKPFEQLTERIQVAGGEPVEVVIRQTVWGPVAARLKRLTQAPSARYWDGAERPVWALLETRPPHLLNPRFASYDDLLVAAITEVVQQLRSRYAGDLRRATWGQTADQPARHPFSEAIPALSRWLDASTKGASGGDDMPRIHSGVFGGAGAVERFVVSPGQEKDGLFHMPGGQSGHFLSPFYRAGHDAWVQGKPTPLLPGPTRHTLRLISGSGSRTP